ncbi:MAG: apolipoprotein N-acyltransferase [Chthoniobacteraceae bacterium]
MTGRGLVRKISPWVAAMSSGVLIALCFPRFDQSWLCWVALTPLLWALWFSPDDGATERRVWLKKAGLGFCTGVTFFCITFFWLTTVTGLMEPRVLGFLAWFGLMCYLALYFGLWGWFAGCVAFPAGSEPAKFLSSRHNLRLGVICAAAWVGQEWLRGTVFSGFGWNNIGVALHANILLIQIADITGVDGMSFMVVMCNVIAALTVRRFVQEVRSGKVRPHYDFTLTVAMVGVIFAYGVHAVMQREETIPLRVAAVQANVPENEKFNYEFEDKILQRYQGLTDTAIAMNPQLLLWPEAATPRGMFADQENYDFVENLAAKGDFSFLLGTLDSDKDGDYNVAVLLTEHGKKPQTHRKMHLVPFGEYIPARHEFPLFAKLAGDLVPGDFRPGTEYNVLQMQNPPVKLGALICFEDTLGDLTRHFVLNGAQALVNITNDGWFLKSAAAEQQLAHAVFRTVETRRPLIRCANTGVTCFIDTSGRVGQTLRSEKGDSFVEGILFGSVNVPVNGPLTFYVRHGQWLAYASLAMSALLIAMHFLKRRA